MTGLSRYRSFYETKILPRLFHTSAMETHQQALHLAQRFDHFPTPLHWLQQLVTPQNNITVGRVDLPSPFMLAAGFVKGMGFADEQQALDAIEQGINIIPGWRSVPAITGVVEFGSFTRWPRVGNEGVVLWRDVEYHSLQNRVGLKNPGARAAAVFLAMKKNELPKTFGLNIAVSPGVTDPQQEADEVLISIHQFLDRGIHPSWFTLNLSCPNTEDDPQGNQTEAKARHLSQVVRQAIGKIPLWVKVSPALSEAQYHALMSVFAETGVDAVIATNTLGQPAPDGTTAGVSGGRLFPSALEAVRTLHQAKKALNAPVDIVACGGVLSGAHAAQMLEAGALAIQYWSALIYRGPLAAAVLQDELSDHTLRTLTEAEETE